MCSLLLILKTFEKQKRRTGYTEYEPNVRRTGLRPAVSTDDTDDARILNPSQESLPSASRGKLRSNQGWPAFLPAPFSHTQSDLQIDNAPWSFDGVILLCL